MTFTHSILHDLAIAGCGGLAAYVIFWFRHRRHLRVAQQKEGIEEERRRIARDMHDETGAKLTRIAILSDLAQGKTITEERRSELLGTISSTARETIQRFDQIVWAINPRHDTLESFAQYLTIRATKYFENTGLACHLDIPSQLPSVPLPASIRQNLLRASEEAMSNTLKHANAREVRVKLSVTAGTFEVSVSDDGLGIPETPESPEANGLRYLRRRMEDIGGNCTIESSPEQGTRVSLRINLNHSNSNNNT